VVSIGPETSAAAREVGLVVLAEAKEPGVDGIARAVVEAG
jgi:uroporphyrinogen-III synthase